MHGKPGAWETSNADSVAAERQLFKSTVKVWTRDRFSILAQLCTTKPKLPKLCVEDDAFFFDRDFWIFQFIYAFLRDNSLPSAVDVLRELYCEASFYRIGLLRHAIESTMMGEDTMAASVLASTASSTLATRVTPSSQAPLPPSSSSSSTMPLPSTRPGSSSLSAILTKSKQQEPGGGAMSKAVSPPSPAHKYSELPDPFGFTSKKI